VPVGNLPVALGLFIGPAATPAAIPTLFQWGMILLALSLLTLATWQLAGRPMLLEVATPGGGLFLVPSRRLLRSVVVGQGGRRGGSGALRLADRTGGGSRCHWRGALRADLGRAAGML
jgi:hypothetical protein